MSGDRTTQLQALLDRLLQGDDAARWELIGRAYKRLEFLARQILHKDFPRLRRNHGTGSALNEAVIRLSRALEEVHPSSCRDFFNFAAVQMRRVLLDWAVKPPPLPSLSAGDDPVDADGDPAELAVWTEFHQKVEQLPPKEREVVDLYWYHGLTQAETAEILRITPRMVSHHWVSARLKLADWVPGFQEMSRKRGRRHGP
jgi:RNA polymerase sigma factor (sigma-70 family)